MEPTTATFITASSSLSTAAALTRSASFPDSENNITKNDARSPMTRIISTAAAAAAAGECDHATRACESSCFEKCSDNGPRNGEQPTVIVEAVPRCGSSSDETRQQQQQSQQQQQQQPQQQQQQQQLLEAIDWLAKFASLDAAVYHQTLSKSLQGRSDAGMMMSSRRRKR
jgi:hypothetical protein